MGGCWDKRTHHGRIWHLRFGPGPGLTVLMDPRSRMTSNRFSKTLLLAWGLFLISLLLPSVSFSSGEKSMPGWACAWICAAIPFYIPEGWWGGAIYCFLFTVPN